MNNCLLIVDDDPEFTAYAGAVGKASGYEVLEITDSRKFERSLESWSPSHVLVDLDMPTIDGLEILRILARGRSRASVVLCSAAARNFMEAADRLGKRLGLNMSGIIKKPPGVAELKTFLESLRTESLNPVSVHLRFDRSVFDAAFGAMGREWVHRGLMRLITHSESTFTEQMLVSPDCQQLARRAHALVSYAGILGFSELARLCEELANACDKGGDLSSLMQKVHVASRFVCGKARELIADLMTEAPT